MSEFIAVFCSGVFFGAALYITLAQHPASLEAGPSFAARFFSPMYRRAAPMQVALAALGTLAGLWTWWRGAGVLWLLGSLSLFAVIPFTLVRIMPVNNQLLAPGRDAEAADTEPLLHRWGALHAVRTVLSGLAFVVLLGALASR
jgi:Anthrone oxygenase